MDPALLIDLEEIKQLKARYFRLMDAKRWEEWKDVFTEDCTLANGPPSDPQVEGRDAIVEYVSKAIQQMITTHHGHMPEIDFDSATEARGIWAMFDYLEAPGYEMKGWGHYHETYRKCEDGRWRIASTRLTRLRVECNIPAVQDALWPEGKSIKTW